jgi:hypothetical protein
MSGLVIKTCPTCSTTFECGACWCAKYPPIMTIEPNNGCYCPDCLHGIMVVKIKDIMNNLTPDIINKIKALPPTDELLNDIDYSINSKGEKVFSKWYHLKKDDHI